MNAIARALGNSARSYLSAKAAASRITENLLARGPSGVITHRPDLAQSHEQLRHFSGWVYSAIRPIAQRIAGQPIHVGRISGPIRVGVKAWTDAEPLDNHELLGLFADPNDLMVAWSLMFSTVASLELTGRQLWWLPGSREIWPIPTSWIRDFEGATRYTAFRVQPPHTAEAFSIPADECVLFSYPHPADPHAACSPLQAVAGAVDADEAIIASQASMFRNGIHPAHAIIVGKDPESDRRPRLTGPQQRQIVEAIRKRYAGTHQHGEPLILDGLIEDVKSLSNTPKEMDYLKSGAFTKERIMQGFGTNPIVAGQVEGSNRASADAADRHFIQYTVNPKIELLSQTLTGWLRYVFADQSLVVWIEPCVPHDAEMQIRWAETLAKYGTITGDELRALAPFTLEDGNFPDPVAPGQQRDPQLDDSMETLNRAMADLKAFDAGYAADRILAGIDGNVPADDREEIARIKATLAGLGETMGEIRDVILNADELDLDDAELADLNLDDSAPAPAE